MLGTTTIISPWLEFGLFQDDWRDGKSYTSVRSVSVGNFWYVPGARMKGYGKFEMDEEQCPKSLLSIKPELLVGEVGQLSNALDFSGSILIQPG